MVQGGARDHPGADLGVLLDDHPRRRGPQEEGLARPAALLDPADLVVGNVPVGQPPPGGLEQVRGAGRGAGAGGLPGPVHQPAGQEELLLRGDHGGAVDPEHGLPPSHVGSRVVHEELLHPALDLRVQAHQAALVVGHGAHGPHLAGHGLLDRVRVGDADPSPHFVGEPDRAVLRAAGHGGVIVPAAAPLRGRSAVGHGDGDGAGAHHQDGGQGDLSSGGHRVSVSMGWVAGSSRPMAASVSTRARP